MARLILTFENLFQVLSADRLLRNEIKCRPTPTPPGLSTAICGISLELLDGSQKDLARDTLTNAGLQPRGFHEIP